MCFNENTGSHCQTWLIQKIKLKKKTNNKKADAITKLDWCQEEHWVIKLCHIFIYKMPKSNANQYCLNGIRSVGMCKIRPGEIVKILDNGSVSCKRYR